jgi:hypothetical protein
MRVPPVTRDALGRPADKLVFRACATFYAASLDADAYGSLVAGLAARGVRAEGTQRPHRGIVTVAFGLDAVTAEAASRDAQALLEAAGLAAGLGDAPHALSVVRVAR